MNEYMEKIAQKAMEDELQKLGVSFESIGKAIAKRKSGISNSMLTTIFAKHIFEAVNPRGKTKEIITGTQYAKPNLKKLVMRRG